MFITIHGEPLLIQYLPKQDLRTFLRRARNGVFNYIVNHEK
jgi:hypothetical protein